MNTILASIQKRVTVLQCHRGRKDTYLMSSLRSLREKGAFLLGLVVDQGGDHARAGEDPLPP